MSATLAKSVRSAYQLAFQVSPIFLTGGLAGETGMLPIIALVSNGLGFVQGTITSFNVDLDNFPFQFQVLPGGTLINQTVGMYPFANREVAANAVIHQPNMLSMAMIAPVNTDGGYLTKLAFMTSLVTSLEQHNNLGGTYTVATPAKIYQNGVMMPMRHLDAPTVQQQIQFQIDFIFPLITQAQAQGAQSSLMSALSGEQKIPDAAGWSGLPTALTQGINSMTGALGSLVF